MSIPRLAIQRPVTMFMISGVITLLGVISLTRLPVDLMPEFEQPQLTVRTNYTGVGPLEMEELITRPMEQAVSAVPGLTRVDSTSSEGNSQVRLNFEWGTDLAEAADEVRTRIDRMRNRLPEDADPPTIFKFDSNALPIMQIGVEGDFDPVTLRELAQNELSPRFERVDGVAAVTVNGGLRRQIHVELSKEKITALNLSVNNIVQTLKHENQNTPLGEMYQGDSTFLVRSQGQFARRRGHPERRADDAGGRAGLHARHRRGEGHHRAAPLVHADQRQAGRAGAGAEAVGQEHRVGGPKGVRAEVERVNNEVQDVHMIVMQDNSLFIERAINNVQEHALIGGILVVLIIFAFLRDFRSTLIVCTSIPVSVIGTFALLYFSGYTLNTMTFGGLALGIGMIVDAAIVVLENTHRHLHMGKDRMTASIEGSEEVWSAILASTLTHIAVFIPLLFLSGTASIMFTQLSVVVMFSLAMSLFVAVTIVPVLCSRWLHTPDEEATPRRLTATLYRISEGFLERMDEAYRRTIHVALSHRPTVIGAAALLVVAASSSIRASPSSCCPRRTRARST